MCFHVIRVIDSSCVAELTKSMTSAKTANGRLLRDGVCLGWFFWEGVLS